VRNPPKASLNSYFFNCAIIALKPSSALSKFSTISSANTSGSGRLSKSASDLSFSQVMSKEVLSEFSPAAIGCRSDSKGCLEADFF
jgi:hypothetical protein